ncbi:MAG: hypothetical protein Q8P56_04990 [Candidatus Uhrbacteria bacterium]|nr:hypothetical protein [Candidatus Uhrbacteria bacterium]
MSSNDDDTFESLIAAGILIAVGYATYRFLKSFGRFEEGSVVSRADLSDVPKPVDTSTKLAYIKYGDEVYSSKGNKIGTIKYGDELYDISGKKIGFLKYGDEIYDNTGVKVGYVKYGDELFDSRGNKIAYAKYSDEIFKTDDFDLSTEEALRLTLGFAAAMTDSWRRNNDD